MAPLHSATAVCAERFELANLRAQLADVRRVKSEALIGECDLDTRLAGEKFVERSAEMRQHLTRAVDRAD